MSVASLLVLKMLGFQNLTIVSIWHDKILLDSLKFKEPYFFLDEQFSSIDNSLNRKDLSDL